MPANAPNYPSDHFDRAAFARDLTAWFRQSQRTLPWREAENARDPYRVLVSEVMLQQTTVAAVVPFYQRFLARFPTLQVLAEANIDDVLPFWAGLGYYSRARNLHRCAQEIVEKHDGVFPRALDEVLALPGIGRYTAGAVTSIAYDAPNPIVDANVMRVLARVCLIEGDLKKPLAQSKLWNEATQLVNAAHENGCAPSDFNPAMMELGALICRPRDPQCENCPVRTHCAAQKLGRQNELPFIAPKNAPTPLHDVCVWAQREENGERRWLLRQRSHEPGIWWRGLWEWPRTTVQSGEDESAALNRLLSELEISARVEKRLATLKHGVTTFAITLDCYQIEVEYYAPRNDVQWFSQSEIENLALPSPMKRLWDKLRADVPQLSLFDE